MNKEIVIKEGPRFTLDQLPKVELLRKGREITMRKHSPYPDGVQPHY